MQNKADTKTDFKKENSQIIKSNTHSLSGSKSHFNSKIDIASTTDNIGVKNGLSSGKLKILKNNLANNQR